MIARKEEIPIWPKKRERGWMEKLWRRGGGAPVVVEEERGVGVGKGSTELPSQRPLLNIFAASLGRIIRPQLGTDNPVGPVIPVSLWAR
jgi:hypothetical protein